MDIAALVRGAWPGWEIESLIGEGTYAKVYRAANRSKWGEKTSAIKVIRIPRSGDDLDEFSMGGRMSEGALRELQNTVEEVKGEVRLMEQVKRCDNVVTIEDYKIVRHAFGTSWVVLIRMELLKTLNQRVKERVLSEREVIRMGLDLCSALVFCRQKNIVHRDIKPGNIFISDKGAYKLGDFGVARRLDQLTSGFTRIGTYNYMAPELFNFTLTQTDIDSAARVDIYSLGIVLYQLMNDGNLPLCGSDSTSDQRQNALARRMGGAIFPGPRKASPAFSHIILRACAYQPKDRFSSAQEMYDQLLKLYKSHPGPEDSNRRHESAAGHRNAARQIRPPEHGPNPRVGTSRGQLPIGNPSNLNGVSENNRKIAIGVLIGAAAFLLLLLMVVVAASGSNRAAAPNYRNTVPRAISRTTAPPTASSSPAPPTASPSPDARPVESLTRIDVTVEGEAIDPEGMVWLTGNQAVVAWEADGSVESVRVRVMDVGDAPLYETVVPGSEQSCVLPVDQMRLSPGILYTLRVDAQPMEPGGEVRSAMGKICVPAPIAQLSAWVGEQPLSEGASIPLDGGLCELRWSAWGSARRYLLEISDSGGSTVLRRDCGGEKRFLLNVDYYLKPGETYSLRIGAEPMGRGEIRWIGGALSAPESGSNPVRFSDPTIESAVRDALNRPEGDLLPGDLLALEELNLSGMGLSDITDLALLPGLRYVMLDQNDISDLSPLAGYDAIEVLNLWGNSIEDISALSGLTRLQNLYLNQNRIVDLTPLAGLSELSELFLHQNAIRDISPLSGLEKLDTLLLWENQIRDISALSNLRGLTKLDLGDNDIRDVSPLSELTQLVYLHMGGNRASDIAPLSGLTRLQELWLNQNGISDLTPLSGMAALQDLLLQENAVTDVSPLRGMAALQTLYLWGNAIEDVSPLSGLTQLRELYLYQNRIRDIAPLKDLTDLNTLYLWGNEISDITALSAMTRLQRLALGDNAVSEIAPLKGLTELRAVYLNQNRISDVGPLSDMASLEILSLRHNNVSDIGPLSGLTRLRELDLRENPIVDYTPLDALTDLERLER